MVFEPPASRAPYASDPARSRGRLFAEPESPTRTAFQRDRDRIIHSTAFRRLQYKTQVFVYHEGDHYRTRLTHSLEVAQIARSICRVLGLDEDLGEALALAHDLGHPAFGHSGEEALRACMADYGGFDHNAQSLRVVTRLEQRYAGFDGLNLTWEALEGIAKHNGPLVSEVGDIEGLPFAMREYQGVQDLELGGYPSAEAQVAALADDIAYNNHDIDDGLRAGLFTVEQLMELPLVGAVFDEVRRGNPNLAIGRVIHEGVRRLISLMVDDLLAQTRANAAAAKLGSVEDVRSLGRPLVSFSAEMAANDRAVKDFLYAHMYRHHRVNEMMRNAQRLVSELFALFLRAPENLPEGWRGGGDMAAGEDMARVVCDYIAGMTDKFALEEHARLIDLRSGV